MTIQKEEILRRTNNGLDVFRHYITTQWRVGRNFLNPLYDDRQASCNIYYDRKSGTYKMKDFGNPQYSGDCFFLVAALNGLDCNIRSTAICGKEKRTGAKGRIKRMFRTARISVQ